MLYFVFLDRAGQKKYNKFIMKYIELTVHTSSEASELIADVMWEYTVSGVAISDVADVIALQKDKTVFWDYIDDGVANDKGDVLVKCFLELDGADDAIGQIMREIRLRQELAGGEIPFGTLEETKREIDGDDWIDVWKKHFRPIHIGKRVVVVPEWIDYKKEPHEVVVLLDSNMAFGTGEHETTSMCLEFLQETLETGDVCIDVGCGSGILGIAAAKLGAQRCYLTDIDPIAVESSTHNALKNGVAESVVVAHSNLLDDSDVKGDIVLANITAEILVMLAPSMPKNLKEKGTLILSGILNDRVGKVKDAFGAVGLKTVQERHKGEWCALVLERGN